MTHPTTMAARIFLAVFVFFALGAAFTIPAKQTEGFYIASFDENGQEVHKKLDIDLSAAAPQSNFNAKLTKRAPVPIDTQCRSRTVSNDHMFGTGHAWDQFWSGCGALGDQLLKNKRAFYVYY